jgi:urate oxidase
MAIHLQKNAYGKNAINLSKIMRYPDRHEFSQITVDIALQGDFEAAHTTGDNGHILPTDTMKNTVYALAKDRFTGSIEAFGLVLAGHFLDHNPQVGEASVTLTEYCWKRLMVEGAAHPHAFINGGLEKRLAVIVASRDAWNFTAGIQDLLILKTTDSGFEGYIKDQYTTLKETADRILSTSCDVRWQYDRLPDDPEGLFQAVRENLLQTFAGHKSLSVQHTLYAMGECVLRAFPAVTTITLQMPNKHHIPFNLQPFGLENNNEIFVATDEPYGFITGTVSRD